MSKLGCACGNVIYDQTDDLPYKGKIIRDKHSGAEFEEMVGVVASYVQAAREGKSQDWLMRRDEEYAKLGLDDTSIIYDLISLFFLDNSLDIYQCDECGRIHIQKENNRFISFKPEPTDAQGLLNVEEKKE
jgi:hypothetical protein